ncbi:aminoglycoside phosphotransferase family protein [Actinoplanes sp. NEAU-A12]|uniref:Aminoglycoside phosphotransferase family protein n=1 Tax=Actinoplanes sandaracinus TaxID=3045177 RepID=A0ABT6WV66_9ACTN|nr:aminoglycoside phosphotransferase family protein [Actinoplanes sandaracinus]MDI6103628.1 aminoglycoside phosphotransferase family protein [Actinoplanes sandaracinus]
MLARLHFVVDIALSVAFTRNVKERWGDAGLKWLAGLPELTARLLRDWDLRLADPLPLSRNWVSRVHQADGTTAVLKLGVPETGHLADEATALECFDGRGAIAVLARDDARGVLLLEDARPGIQARSLVPRRDEEVTAALIGIIKRLHRPAPAGVELPRLSRRGASFARHLHRFPGEHMLPRHLVERAGSLFGELCATATGPVVLHGDLHHDNVLAAEREPWLAIDPHGVVGDPGYEIGAMLYNPDPAGADDTVLGLVEARMEQLADGLGMPPERVVAWGFVQAVLSEVWTFEGNGVMTGRPLRLARRLLPLLPD